MELTGLIATLSITLICSIIANILQWLLIVELYVRVAKEKQEKEALKKQRRIKRKKSWLDRFLIVKILRN